MNKLLTTSRITGLFYLGMIPTGIVGYLLLSGQLYVPTDANATLANVENNQALAYVGLAAQLGIVLFQALAAVWFFKLFRQTNSFAAGVLAAFGLVNAVGVSVGLMFASQAVAVALSTTFVGDQAATVQLLWSLHASAWTVTSLFFGLWLIPMGYLVLAAKAPRLLGWVIIAGGLGYIISAFLQLAAPTSTATLTSILSSVSIIGEFWIVGYLLRGKFRGKVTA